MTEIRLVKAEDVEGIAELEKKCFTDPWSLIDFEGAVLSPVTTGLVALEEGELVGYGFIAIVFEDADVANIAVSPLHRNKGVGRRLLEELLTTAKERGVQRVFLEVRVSNAPAISLYQGFGFQTVNVRKKYYPDGEDAYLMVLEL